MPFAVQLISFMLRQQLELNILCVGSQHKLSEGGESLQRQTQTRAISLLRIFPDHSEAEYLSEGLWIGQMKGGREVEVT